MQLEYDARGNLLKRTDPAGNVTTWEIRGDKPFRRTDPDGIRTEYTYNEAGHLVRLTNRLGLTYDLCYDKLGRLSLVRGRMGWSRGVRVRPRAQRCAGDGRAGRHHNLWV